MNDIKVVLCDAIKVELLSKLSDWVSISDIGINETLITWICTFVNMVYEPSKCS